MISRISSMAVRRTIEKGNGMYGCVALAAVRADSSLAAASHQEPSNQAALPQ
jgi:hypothetical protein